MYPDAGFPSIRNPLSWKRHVTECFELAWGPALRSIRDVHLNMNSNPNSVETASQEDGQREKGDDSRKQFSRGSLDLSGAIKGVTAYRRPEWKVENVLKELMAYASTMASKASTMKVSAGRLKVPV